MPHATSTDGVKIFYTTIGEGEPLVLVHGVAHTWQSWQDLGYVDALKDRYRLILLDCRGHGESDTPPDPDAYAMPRHVTDILAVLEALAIERCHYWGYSLGATAGFAFAAQHPERLNSLIAYGAHPYPVSRGPETLMDEDLRLLRQGMEAFVDMLDRIGVFAQYPDPAGRRARLLAADPEALISTIDALRANDGVGDQLARLTMPCLIILGEHESAHPQARRAAVELPNGQFIAVPAIGHAMAHADLILPHVDPFLAGLRP